MYSTCAFIGGKHCALSDVFSEVSLVSRELRVVECLSVPEQNFLAVLTSLH